ncbi:MAG: ABC transporter permease [Vicinamibacteria bacterium]
MSLSTTLRSLSRTRGFSAAIVLTLATGIAALTLTFGVINAAIFREPPFDDAKRIALLFIERNEAGEAPAQQRWSFARFQRLRATQKSFEDVASYAPGSLTLSGGTDSAEPVNSECVSAAYFPLLRVGAMHGRVFTEAEDDPASPAPVAVLGRRLWERRYGSDPSVLGQTIRVNGVPLTVIGIAPADFGGLSGRAQLWVPATLTPQLTYADYLTTNQNFISVFGRLRAEVAFEAAGSELAVLGASINRALPSDQAAPDERVTASARLLNDARLHPKARPSLLILMGAVALLHLLACANAVNLLLGRVASKRRDWSVRIALGSSSAQLFRRLLSEGVSLAALGGVGGVLLGGGALSVVSPPTNVWASRTFFGSLAAFDAPAFGVPEGLFALGVTAVTALLIAVIPAMTAFGIEVSAGLRSGSRGIAGGGLSIRRPTTRGLIVGVEAALAMLLVVSAGLLIDSFKRVRQTPLGIDTENVLTFWVIPSEARVPPSQAPAFVTRLLEGIERVPGVLSATVDGGGPVSGTAISRLVVADRPAPDAGQEPPVLRHYIAPNHFRTLGVPVKRGRVFTAADTAEAPRVAIISETAARKFWPNEDPIGRRVWFTGGSAFNSVETSVEIVGVVADVVYKPVDQGPNLSSFYTPYAQFTYASRMVFVKTAGDPHAALAGLRTALASVDPELAMRDVKTLDEVVNGSWSRNRFDAWLFGGFGIVALLLAGSGIFAVLSYAVATRTREFGVRIALGADTPRMLWQVVREGMAFPAVGLLVGVLAALGLTRFLQSSLYEVSAQEPRVFVGTASLLLIVAVAACLIPAWRATRTDPMEALRAE